MHDLARIGWSCGSLESAMVSGPFLLIDFYTRYIRVYLPEYMLYTKGNFIGDPAHWLAEGLSILLALLH